MIFKKTAVVGIGLIGGSLVEAFKKYRISNHIIGISRSDAYIKALKIGVINEGYPIDELQTGIKDADLIILAVPIRKICALIAEIMPKAKPGSIITDVGSTKHVIMEVAHTFMRKGVYFIGGHPMAGSEKAGFDYRSPDLFLNRPYAIVPDKKTPQEVAESLLVMVQTIGAIPITIDAITHDRIVAGISHLPQVAVIALMNAIGRENDSDNRYFQLSGPAFYEITRIAESKYDMWEDILISNRRNISNILNGFIEELKQFKKSLDKPIIREDFDKANAYRDQLLKTGKVLFDVSRDVQNGKP